MVFLPTSAFADHIGAHEGRDACAINVDVSSPDGIQSRARSTVDASIDRTTAAAAADATFTMRSGLENSEHFANTGLPQIFADDRISFDDVIAFNDVEHGLGQILAALQRGHHEGHGGGGDSHDGDHGEHRGRRGSSDGPSDPPPGANPVLTPQAADPTPNPEPASMLLIGTGLAGLFGFRRRLVP
jgi:hypothetical protein